MRNQAPSPPKISAWPARGNREGLCLSPVAPASQHAQPPTLEAGPGEAVEGAGAVASHTGHSGSLLCAMWWLPARVRLGW